MDKDVVIKVDNVSKKFTRSIKRSMLYGSMDITKSMLGIKPDTSKLRKGEFWSLSDVSLELKKGDGLGILGQNGSGKSTLLRLINGIFPPDKGRIAVKGKIGALIAVGAGFHPHFTGRENIYLNGTILGMSRQQIEQKFESIIEFADIGDFIDAPVSTYSSGMNVRLGFSIAIHSEPEILLADEVLAVGDLSFALKCYRKISEFRRNGGSIILVSHSIQLIRNSCNNALWLDKGGVVDYGPTQDVCDKYEAFMLKKSSKDISNMGVIINTDKRVELPKVEFLNKELKEVNSFKSGEELRMRIHYKCDREIKDAIFTVSISSPENIQVISNYTKYDGVKIPSIKGTGYVDFVINNISLKSSEYRCTITFTENDDINNHLVWHDKAHVFKIMPGETTSYGIINPHPKWEVH